MKEDRVQWENLVRANNMLAEENQTIRSQMRSLRLELEDFQMTRDVVVSGTSEEKEARQEWGTPDDLFWLLNRTFKFELDVCASEWNKKCEKHYTKADNGLTKSWVTSSQGWAWCNPPFGEIFDWSQHAKREVERSRNARTVMIIPANTDTAWFEQHVWMFEIIFLKGRVNYVPPPGVTTKSGSSFPSMLVLFRRPEEKEFEHTVLDWKAEIKALDGQGIYPLGKKRARRGKNAEGIR